MGFTPGVPPKMVTSWVIGELFGLMHESKDDISDLKINPEALGGLLILIQDGVINNTTGKSVLAVMLESGKSAAEIVGARGLGQISNAEQIAERVESVLRDNPDQVTSYLEGKDVLSNWFFGQVMQATRGKANPQVVRTELERQLQIFRDKRI